MPGRESTVLEKTAMESEELPGRGLLPIDEVPGHLPRGGEVAPGGHPREAAEIPHQVRLIEVSVSLRHGGPARPGSRLQLPQHPLKPREAAQQLRADADSLAAETREMSG